MEGDNAKSPSRSEVLEDLTDHLDGQAPMRSLKLFTVMGCYPTVKNCLRARGWVEKVHRPRDHLTCSQYICPFKINNRASEMEKRKHCPPQPTEAAEVDDEDSDVSREEGKLGGKNSKNWELRTYPANFIWTGRKDQICYDNLNRDQVINHFSITRFTTKVGLAAILKNVYWHGDVSSDDFFPRCYCLSSKEEREEFLDNFRVSACVSVIRWVLKRASEGTRQRQTYTVLPERILRFALKQAMHFLAYVNHEDLEKPIKGPPLAEIHWNLFLQWTYDLFLHDGEVEEWPHYINECQKVSKQLEKVWLQWNIDGARNVWIVKPGAKSRGKGILIKEKLEDIVKFAQHDNNNFVVQKYIEEPFLYYGTKFDIRQWFLVTDWNPLTVWVYKECYIRLCSRPFSLVDKSEDIHLCNNAIQARYLRSNIRQTNLPEGNMLTKDDFKEYLDSLGYFETWDTMVYPAIKDCIVKVLQCNEDKTYERKNSFELYGADFMLDKTLRPWLLEINSSPCLAATTPVTTKLCANVIDDTLRVVLDLKENPNCYTGEFEMAYRRSPISLPAFSGLKMMLDGCSIKRPSQQVLSPAISNNAVSIKSTLSKRRLRQTRPRANMVDAVHYVAGRLKSGEQLPPGRHIPPTDLSLLELRMPRTTVKKFVSKSKEKHSDDLIGRLKKQVVRRLNREYGITQCRIIKQGQSSNLPNKRSTPDLETKKTVPQLKLKEDFKMVSTGPEPES